MPVIQPRILAVSPRERRSVGSFNIADDSDDGGDIGEVARRALRIGFTRAVYCRPPLGCFGHAAERSTLPLDARHERPLLMMRC